jgi:hypothetical protein
MSDLDIDANYVVGAGNVCYDYTCCHSQDVPAAESQIAGTYGDHKCNMPLDGYKKMMDKIIELNQTSWGSFTSFIYGGSSNAYVPDQLTEAQTYDTIGDIIRYARSLMPHNGIYFTLGPHDMYPYNYQDFTAISNATLSSINTQINRADTDSIVDWSSISASHDTTANPTGPIAEFLAWGYYKVTTLVYSILIDSSSPAQ